jgi:hypothetical protein
MALEAVEDVAAVREPDPTDRCKESERPVGPTEVSQWSG